MSGKPVLPSSRHRAMSSSILHSASAPNVWLFDLSRDIGVRESGTAESAERIHEVKRSWLDCFGNGQLHIVHADTGELIGRTGPQGSRCGVRTQEAVAEQRRERNWKRTELPVNLKSSVRVERVDDFSRSIYVDDKTLVPLDDRQICGFEHRNGK